MGQTLDRCDICRTPITVYFRLHDCKPNFDGLVRLVPGYDKMLPDEQARWIESIQCGLNRGHKPEWYTEHQTTVGKLVSKYGEHLIHKTNPKL